MKLNIKYIIVILFFTIPVYSQWINEDVLSNSRLLDYKNFEYSNFELSKNPAWLSIEEINDNIRINSFYSVKNNDLRKKYSAGQVNLFNVTGSTIKKLKSLGVFYGRFDYLRETREDTYQILTRRYNTGNPFHLRDNTSGDFKYSGPGMSLMYSAKLLNSLTIGLQADYSVVDGLKQVYSFAESVSRDIKLKGGALLKLTDNLRVAAYYEFNSYHEKLEISDVFLRSVEVFRHRGDKFFIKSLGMTEKEKIENDENVFSVFSDLALSENFNIKLKAKYFTGNTKILIPASYSIENEDGKEVYKAGAINFLAGCNIKENIKVDLGYNLYTKNSKSQNSVNNYLLWNWSFIEHNFGLRVFFDDLIKHSIAGFEFGNSITIADSSKYIDNVYTKEDSYNIHSGVFGQYEINDNLSIRFSYKYTFIDKDHFFGCSNVNSHKTFLEVDYRHSSKMIFSPYLSFESYSAEKRNQSIFFGIKLNIINK